MNFKFSIYIPQWLIPRSLRKNLESRAKLLGKASRAWRTGNDIASVEIQTTYTPTPSGLT